MKQCSKCMENKKHTEFYAHKTNLDGLSGKCKECTKQYSREWHHRNMKNLHFRKKQAEKTKRYMRTLLVLAMLFVGNVYGQKVNLETKVKPSQLELYLVEDLQGWDFHGCLISGKLVKQKKNESILFLNYELADCIVFVEYDIVVKTILQLEDRIITTQFLEDKETYERRKLLD